MDLISSENFEYLLTWLLDPAVYFFLLLGSLVGLVFGAIPGLTAPAAIALVLPLTYGMGVNGSLALLLGVYVSGYFAGSIPAILLNTPGTPGNAATALEGYPLAKAGDGAFAISTAISSSFVGVLISVVLLLTIAPLMARVALSFTSVEYFALSVLGILCVAGISTGSLAKGLAAALLGILISTIGLDSTSGVPRYTLGMPELLGGIPIIPALIGLFAVSEMLHQSRKNKGYEDVLVADGESSFLRVFKTQVKNKWTLFKSALIGTFVGLLPGTGPAIASWIAYGEAIRGRVTGDKFGKGEVKGLIACETSNNAVIGGAMIPLLTLGIPGDPVTAILIEAMMIHGVEPGPFFMRDHGPLFLSIVVMLLLSNIAMVLFGFSFRTVAAKVLKVPTYVVVPIVISIATVASFAISASSFDVLLLGLFGTLGFLMISNGFPVAAVVLGIVLGPILETNFRNALIAHDMDMTVFLTRPVSAGIFALMFVFLIIAQFRRKNT